MLILPLEVFSDKGCPSLISTLANEKEVDRQAPFRLLQDSKDCVNKAEKNCESDSTWTMLPDIATSSMGDT